MLHTSFVEAYVLAGGKSSRMGQDKGLMLFSGIPMVQHVLNVVNNITGTITIVTNHTGYDRLGYPCIKDIEPGLGPIGALYTALQHCFGKYVLLLTCDMPFVTTEMLIRLIKEGERDYEIVIGSSSEGTIHPFPGLYSITIKHKLVKKIETNCLKMQSLINECKYASVKMDDILRKNPYLFFNLNEPVDIEKALNVWKKMK